MFRSCRLAGVHLQSQRWLLDKEYQKNFTQVGAKKCLISLKKNR